MKPKQRKKRKPDGISKRRIRTYVLRTTQYGYVVAKNVRCLGAKLERRIGIPVGTTYCTVCKAKKMRRREGEREERGRGAFKNCSRQLLDMIAC